ncbi:MAG: NADH:ubiquinone reductase (Na(+)-transporting) subunit B [Candidatus Algichlamydia australiensis]|nr:NADH:ubiquinone reductase (Na(+)-transporting) subunit B [Chlamydiales bacterium]
MLRKLFDYGLKISEEGGPLNRFRPLVTALDSFFYEVPDQTRSGPHIRDAIDLKRWMVIVVFALLPCTLMAIWNTGLQKLVYSSGDLAFLESYLEASKSFPKYFQFGFSHIGKILLYGCGAFLPVLIISYAVGGFWEALFAIVRRHEISEGFLVSGILFALILPPTIPYWMVAVGVSAGIILSKELFGGSGMNILNPALTCRCFLFFAYPTKMAGQIWVGTNPVKIKESIQAMNHSLDLGTLDGISQDTPLGIFNIPFEIKRIHVDAIATQFTEKVGTWDLISLQFAKWSALFAPGAKLGMLNPTQLKNFITAKIESGGLGLSPENFESAFQFAKLKWGSGLFTNGNFFFGNMLGSMGETSTLFVLFGALVLLVTRIGSWRSMLAMLIGALGIAYLFEFASSWIGPNHGAWNPAKFDFPAYKHLLIGSFAFGLVFMLTDPVSSPSLNRAKWIYGIFVGAMAILIRTINPAYPEGVMLAILLGNVFAPLFDHFALKRMRRRRYESIS